MVAKDPIHAAQKRLRRIRAKAYVTRYLEDHPCLRCGEADVRVLTFHHREPEHKSYKVSTMISRGMDLPLIAQEIAKCDVLCSNCHLIYHDEEREAHRERRR